MKKETTFSRLTRQVQKGTPWPTDMIIPAESVELKPLSIWKDRPERAYSVCGWNKPFIPAMRKVQLRLGKDSVVAEQWFFWSGGATSGYGYSTLKEKLEKEKNKVIQKV